MYRLEFAPMAAPRKSYWRGLYKRQPHGLYLEGDFRRQGNRPRSGVRLWGNQAGHEPAFPRHEGMSLEITEELIARQPSEAQPKPPVRLEGGLRLVVLAEEAELAEQVRAAAVRITEVEQLVGRDVQLRPAVVNRPDDGLQG